MEVTEVKLKPGQEYITLQSLLQIGDIISTGGMAKVYLESEKVLVNNVLENRRGRKLYPNDLVVASGKTFLIVKPC